MAAWNLSIVRLPGVERETGNRHSAIYLGVQRETITPPVSAGGRSKGWLEYELAAILTARAAGATDDDLRPLVRGLIKARTHPEPIIEARRLAGELVAALSSRDQT
jgi:prophage regulatory protein